MYTDVITKLRNAQAAKKATVKIPFSKMDMAVLEVLKLHGMIDDVQKKGRMPKRVIEVKPKYEEGKGKIEGARFLSKPSRHVYAGYQDRALRGRGHELVVVSTPRGIMSSKEAVRQKLGGEVLFKIW